LTVSLNQPIDRPASLWRRQCPHSDRAPEPQPRAQEHVPRPFSNSDAKNLSDCVLVAAQETPQGREKSSFRRSGGKPSCLDLVNPRPDWEALRQLSRNCRRQDVSAGVDSFLRRCRDRECPALIVTHRRKFGRHDPDRINLRRGCSRLDERTGASSGTAATESRLKASTSRARGPRCSRRIGALRCTHFIDDLEEVLNDPQFPPGRRGEFCFSRWGVTGPVCAPLHCMPVLGTPSRSTFSVTTSDCALAQAQDRLPQGLIGGGRQGSRHLMSGRGATAGIFSGRQR